MSGVSLSNVSHSFDDRPVLRSVNLECTPGRITVVMGPSGAGKSTLLRILGGLVEPDQGTIDGVSRKTRSSVSYMPQGDSLLPWLRAVDNVLIPLRVGLAKVEIGGSERARAAKLLDQVGLGSYSEYFPAKLSGGMRQRVAIARSFISDPTVLLLDEPFSALDERNRHALELMIIELVRSKMVTCVFVTHSVDQALSIGDRVCILSGKPASIAHTFEIAAQRPLSPARFGELRAALREELNA